MATKVPPDDIEKKFMQLITEYTPQFSEELKLESQDDYLYISDIETYEIYYLSAAENSKLWSIWQDYSGRKCYDVFHNRTSPCPFCKNHLIKEDKFYIWIYNNTADKRNCLHRDILIEWENEKAHLGIVIDINDPLRIAKMLKDEFESQDFLIGCIEPLAHEHNVNLVYKKLFERMGDFYNAESGGAYFFDKDITKNAQYYWNLNIPPPATLFSALFSKEKLEALSQVLIKGKLTVIVDIEQIKKGFPEVYDYLKSSAVSSICIAPIYINDNLTGILYLKNIKDHYQELRFMNILATFIAGRLQMVQLEAENHSILYLDTVTGYQTFEGYKIAVREILNSNNGKRRYSLWYCDLKNFKYINDVFGYDVGNRILKYWAELVAEDTRMGETFTRVSADNFSSLRWYDNLDDLIKRFEDAAHKLEKYPETVERKFKLELASGIYLIQEGENLSIEEMLNRANIAQKSVKKLPGSNIAFYSEEMRQHALDELLMKAELKEAMKNEEFLLYMQAQQKIQDNLLSPLRAEVLVRWKRNGKHIILPGEFIGLFESDGAIVDLDMYVFEHTCRFIHSIKHLPPVCLSINVSKISMLQPDFVREYSTVKKMYGIPDGAIELEFTEDIAVENFEQFREIIAHLKENGFSCAMDDFGTGHSSLNVLKNLPIDVLKLDKHFFDPTGEENRSIAIVSCILEMAKKLNMATVAEGIESESQVGILKDMGCDYIQGYVFSKPIESDEFKKLLL